MSWTNNSLINKYLSFVPLILREAKLKIVAWFILEQSSERGFLSLGNSYYRKHELRRSWHIFGVSKQGLSLLLEWHP